MSKSNNLSEKENPNKSNHDFILFKSRAYIQFQNHHSIECYRPKLSFLKYSKSNYPSKELRRLHLVVEFFAIPLKTSTISPTVQQDINHIWVNSVFKRMKFKKKVLHTAHKVRLNASLCAYLKWNILILWFATVVFHCSIFVFFKYLNRINLYFVHVRCERE